MKDIFVKANLGQWSPLYHLAPGATRLYVCSEAQQTITAHVVFIPPSVRILTLVDLNDACVGIKLVPFPFQYGGSVV